jgi:hypothetical protein
LNWVMVLRTGLTNCQGQSHGLCAQEGQIEECSRCLHAIASRGSDIYGSVVCKALDFVDHCRNRSANCMRSTSFLYAYYSERMESAVIILFWLILIPQQRKAWYKERRLVGNNTRGFSSHVPVLGSSGFSARLDSTEMEINFGQAQRFRGSPCAQ